MDNVVPVPLPTGPPRPNPIDPYGIPRGGAASPPLSGHYRPHVPGFPPSPDGIRSLLPLDTILHFRFNLEHPLNVPSLHSSVGSSNPLLFNVVKQVQGSMEQSLNDQQGLRSGVAAVSNMIKKVMNASR